MTPWFPALPPFRWWSDPRTDTREGRFRRRDEQHPLERRHALGPVRQTFRGRGARHILDVHVRLTAEMPPLDPEGHGTGPAKATMTQSR